MREVTWILFGFVVTNHAIILCCSNPDIYLVLSVAVYGIACNILLCLLCSVCRSYCIHLPERLTYSMDLFLFLANNRNVAWSLPEIEGQESEELDVIDTGVCQQ